VRVPTQTIYAGHLASFSSIGPYVRANLYALVFYGDCSRTFIRVAFPPDPLGSLRSRQRNRRALVFSLVVSGPASQFHPYTYGAQKVRRSLLPMLLPHRVGAAPSLRTPQPNLREPGASLCVPVSARVQRGGRASDRVRPAHFPQANTDTTRPCCHADAALHVCVRTYLRT